MKKTFRLPDGSIADFDIHEEGPAVCVLALTDKNEVVLTKQFRPGPEKILCEFPGGKISENESPEEAIRREFLEETGFTGEFTFVGKSLDAAYSSMLRYNFVAQHCKKIQEPQGDETEFVEVVLMDLSRFRNHLRSGELTDIETGYLCLDFLGLP